MEWIGDRRVVARVEGKQSIEVTAPPEFRGTDPSTWSPEDFFVAAAASCLAVTFTGLAERAGLEYERPQDCRGRRRRQARDGCFGFVRLLLELTVEVDAGDTLRAMLLAREAEDSCLVAVSLDVPTELAVDVVVAHR